MAKYIKTIYPRITGFEVGNFILTFLSKYKLYQHWNPYCSLSTHLPHLCLILIQSLILNHFQISSDAFSLPLHQNPVDKIWRTLSMHKKYLETINFKAQNDSFTYNSCIIIQRKQSHFSINTSCVCSFTACSDSTSGFCDSYSFIQK